MEFSTSHEVLPDALAFADVLGASLSAPATFREKILQFKVVKLPGLRVPSGRITASDGYILDGSPFTVVVPVGEHPLTLAIAIINSDERIAFAQVRFSSLPAVRWSMALVAGQEITTLKTNELFGYGVDSGTGSLADSVAFERLSEASEDIAERMMAESKKVYRHTRDWLSIKTESGSAAVFSSGYGDGVYTSYFGYSASGELASLITDFGLAKWAGNP